MFDKYDADGSGDIDFEEFKVLLHDLNVKLTEPKARAYFKRCDRRRRGCISFEEFRLALFTCDPKNPDRTGVSRQASRWRRKTCSRCLIRTRKAPSIERRSWSCSSSLATRCRSTRWKDSLQPTRMYARWH